MRIKYFSWIRETVGHTEEIISLPSNVRDVSSLLDYLATQSEGHASALKNRSVVKVAVNQVHIKHDHTVSDDDEVALFPPVTGG